MGKQDNIPQISYRYENLPIPGGGYVTGFVFSRREKGVLYARTDIGGTYRFDEEQQRFISLIDHVTMEDLSETFPISIALDEEKPGSLYIACGIGKREAKGVLAISQDYGESFRYEKMPVYVHGNLNGRGTGERLLVEGERILFASQMEGLWESNDGGKTWSRNASLQERYLTFVAKVGTLYLLGTAGVTTSVVSTQLAEQTGQAALRGHSLYVSVDGGRNFDKLEQPDGRIIEGCRYNGLVAQRWAADERYLYVTFASTGLRSYVLENGYSCDSGDTIDGHVVRYDLAGQLAMEDITPVLYAPAAGAELPDKPQSGYLPFGFSGVSVSVQNPGTVLVSTMVKDDGDSLFLSLDYGQTWKQILYDLVEGEITFRSPYMRPECNGGHSLIHWLSDVEINPFDGNEAWFNSGTGVFRTKNLTAPVCCFTDWCDGIEETVHLNVYSLPSGPVQVIDILGDLGGFAFEDVTKPCDNSFADADGNRYITCINADFSDADCSKLVVTPRGNWTGKTYGGLIISGDYGRTFERLKLPYGLSDELDSAFHAIETPNVNSGWVAMSPDGESLVWSVADGITLPVNRVLVSNDGGKHFAMVKIYDLAGRPVTEGRMKVFSDRVDSHMFYGFGDHSRFYVSEDQGRTFRQLQVVILDRESEKISETRGAFPEIEFGLIDCANRTEVRGESGRSGVFYMALGEAGLWKYEYLGRKQGVLLRALTEPGASVFRMGLGLGREGGDYIKEPKMIYFNGILHGTYGFYRTPDEGRSFERLNTDRQMYGEINSIDGDCRKYGRFYLATGSVGIKYGDIC